LNALIDYPSGVKQRLAGQADKITIGGILKAIELFIEAQETAKVMETLRMPLELAFAKLTYGGATGVISSAPAATVSAAAVKSSAAPIPAAASVPKVTIKADSLEDIKANWNALTQEVSVRKMALATFLQDGTPCEFKAGRLAIGFHKEKSFSKDCLDTKENLKFIEELFSQKLGTPVFVSFKLVEKAGDHAKQEEPVVRSALEVFGGKVVKEWPNAQK